MDLQCLATMLPIAVSHGSYFTSSSRLFSLVFFVTFLEEIHEELFAFKDARMEEEKNHVSGKRLSRSMNLFSLFLQLVHVLTSLRPKESGMASYCTKKEGAQGNFIFSLEDIIVKSLVLAYKLFT